MYLYIFEIVKLILSTNSIIFLKTDLQKMDSF